MTEYKLSYTASEIDEKLGMIDSCATEEYINNNATIKPFPIKERIVRGTAAIEYVIDIEELEEYCLYSLGLGESREPSPRLRFRIYGEDGTYKNIALYIYAGNYVIHKYTLLNKIMLQPVLPAGVNHSYEIDIADKSTADNIIVTLINNRDFISTTNRYEYTPTEDYQPATKKYVDDNIVASTVIKPLPIREKQFYDTAAHYYVDVTDLTENRTLYGLGAVPDEEKRANIFIRYCIYCDDGTRKDIGLANPNDLVSVFNMGSACVLYLDGENTDYEINFADKSTADSIIVTKHNPARYLGVSNSVEYTPTKDYNPATKKYVDDAIAALRAELTATTE